jgi:hypothetical protein
MMRFISVANPNPKVFAGIRIESQKKDFGAELSLFICKQNANPNISKITVNGETQLLYGSYIS